jgi:hypothetical protein
MHLRKDKHLQAWADSLASYSVFFSSPLDLDLAMLKAFPDAYAATIPSGRGPFCERVANILNFGDKV